MKTMLHPLLVAGLAPAAVFAQDTAPGTPEQDWFGTQPAPQAQAATEREVAAAQAARELADRMACVYDRATADAAAADVAAIVPRLLDQGGEETFWTRMHMAFTNCYGSPALQKAFLPLLPPFDTTGNPDFAQSIPILMDVWHTLEDIAIAIRGVQDKAGADTAAEMITLFATHLDDCMEKGDSVPAPKGKRMDLVIFFYSGEYQRTAALYKEWGELQNRSRNYYGSQLLAGAMESLSAALENLDQPADPYAIGQMLLISAEMEASMRTALGLLAGIHDRASADAAVPALKVCVEAMQTAAAPLGHGCEKDLDHVSPMFLFLSLSCDRMIQSLRRAGYHGSSDLRDFFEHK